nr:MAG TPA: hypothetical protein [Caudoviricetes sp.]
MRTVSEFGSLAVFEFKGGINNGKNGKSNQYGRCTGRYYRPFCRCKTSLVEERTVIAYSF